MDTLKTFGARVQQLIEGRDLSRDETRDMFRSVLLNEQPELQQGALLAALVAKGETAEEIAGAWSAIDEIDTVHISTDMPGPLVENSGTGMDRLKTFNVSSAAAVVAAACGVRMARHGARALTSFCGTVDILEAVGLDVECEVSVVEKSIREAGIGLFNGMSLNVHPGALFRILGNIRFGSTLNIAASLASPARATVGLRGVYSKSLMEPVAAFMKEIGYERIMVVHGTDPETGFGMDEISACGETHVIHGAGGQVRRFTVLPGDFGIEPIRYDEISATANLEHESHRFVSVLAGKGFEGCQTFTCINAGGVLFVAGLARSFRDGYEMSRSAIESGAALAKLRHWVVVQNRTPETGREKLEGILRSL